MWNPAQKGSIIITEQIHESMLKSFVEIKFTMCSIYIEENSPSKFWEIFQETRDISATQG